MQHPSPPISRQSIDGAEAARAFLDIDVEQELQELASPTAACTATPPPAKGPVGFAAACSVTDPEVGGDEPDGRTQEHSEPVAPATQLPVEEGNSSMMSEEGEGGGSASDSEVIHIDLTSRPPSLPMSGLPLDKLVTVLPGTTYAVPGSGVPLKTPPRSPSGASPRNGPHGPDSPSKAQPGSPLSGAQAKAGDGATTGMELSPHVSPRSSPHMSPRTGSPRKGPPNDAAERAAADPASGNTSPRKRSPLGEVPAAAGGAEGEDGSEEQGHQRSRGGSTRASPRTRPPATAYTFIPGLGLVPVVIGGYSDDEDDEGEEGDSEGEGEEELYAQEQRWRQQQRAGNGQRASGDEHDDDEEEDAEMLAAEAHAAAEALYRTAGFGAGGGADDDDEEGEDEDEDEDGEAAAGGVHYMNEEDLVDALLSGLAGGAFFPGMGAGMGPGGAFPFAAGFPPGGFGGRHAAPAVVVEEEDDSADAAREVERQSRPKSASRAVGQEEAGAKAVNVSEEQLHDIIKQAAEGFGGTPQDSGEASQGDDAKQAALVEDGAAGGEEDEEVGLEGLPRPDEPAVSDRQAAQQVRDAEVQGLAAQAELLIPAAFSAVASADVPVPAGRRSGDGRNNAPFKMFAHPAASPGGSPAAPTLPRSRYGAPDVASAGSGGAAPELDDSPPKDSSPERRGPGTRAPTGERGRAAAGDSASAPGGGGGVNLMNTVRMTGGSMAALRQAALQAEAQRQAKEMAERLGGGADKGDRPRGAAAASAAAADDDLADLLPTASSVASSSSSSGFGSGGGALPTASSSPSLPTSGSTGSVPLRTSSSYDLPPGPFSMLSKSASMSAAVSPWAAKRRSSSGGSGSEEEGDGVRGGGSHDDGGSGSAERSRPNPADVSLHAQPTHKGPEASTTTGAAGAKGKHRHAPGVKHDLGATLRRHHPGGSTAAAVLDAEDESALSLEELLRDRPIIQPRYPTDPAHPQPGEGAERGAHSPPGGSGEAAGGRRPGHRRSVEQVDLDVADLGPQHDEDNPGSPSRLLQQQRRAEAADATPPARSLRAMRKSDEVGGGFGWTPPKSTSPTAADQPRSGALGLHVPRHLHHYFDEEADVEDDEALEVEDDGPHEGSSSAHSVADEKLSEELEALKEELGQKTTLVAGLRGELRKYTDMVSRLEATVSELRVAQGLGPMGHICPGLPRPRSQSETGAPSSSTVEDGSGGAGAAGSDMGASALRASAPQPLPRYPGEPVPPAPPPAPRDPTALAAGLDAPARLAQYKEILSQADRRSFGSGVSSDLRDVQELLAGKDKLDPGMEKVMLIKLQKLVVWGCEKGFELNTQQQTAKFLENQLNHLRAEFNTEREQLKGQLAAAAAASGGAAAAAAGGKGAPSAADAAAVAALKQKLKAAEEDAERMRAEHEERVSDLEGLVASLQSDVRRLRVQLRASGSGVAIREESSPAEPAPAAGGEGRPQVGGGAASEAAVAAAKAESAGWTMERQMLLKTIGALQAELQEAKAAAEAAAAGAAEADEPRAGAGVAPRGAGPGQQDVEELLRELKEEHQAVLRAAEQEREQLQAALALAAAEGVDLQQQLTEARSGAAEGLAAAEAQGDLAAQLAAVQAEAVEREGLVEQLRTELQGAQEELGQAQAALLSQAKLRLELEGLTRELEESRGALQAAQAEAAEAQRALQRAQQAEADAAARKGEMVAGLHDEVAALHGSVGHLQAVLAASRDDAAREAAAAAAATAALAQAQSEADRLRAQVSQLESEVRECNTAQSAEDGVLEQLRGQLAGMERELEAQAALAQQRAERAAELETQLAELEDRRRWSTGSGNGGYGGSSGGGAVGRSKIGSGLPVGPAGGARQAADEEGGGDRVWAGGAEAGREGQRSRGTSLTGEAPAVELQRRLDRVVEEREEALQRVEEAAREREALLRELRDASEQLEAAQERAAQLQQQMAVERRRGDEAHVRLEAAMQGQRRRERRDEEQAARQRAAAAGGGGGGWAGGAIAASADQLAVLRSDKARLLADCVRLQRELDSAREALASEGGAKASPAAAPGLVVAASAVPGGHGAGSGKDGAEARDAEEQQRAAAEQLDAQLAELRAALDGAEREAAAARGAAERSAGEAALRGELLASKERQLLLLSETVEALKVALQSAGGKVAPEAAPPAQPAHTAGSPSSSARGAQPAPPELGAGAPAAAAAAGGAGAAAAGSPAGAPSVLDAETEARLSSYRAHSRELEARLADKDRDIRRLDEKLAALEARLLPSSDAAAPAARSSSASPAASPPTRPAPAWYGSSGGGGGPAADRAADRAAESALRLVERDTEVMRLQRELAELRAQLDERMAEEAEEAELAGRAGGARGVSPGGASRAALAGLGLSTGSGSPAVAGGAAGGRGAPLDEGSSDASGGDAPAGRELGNDRAGGAAPFAAPAAGGSDPASAAQLHELQVQLMQWRALGQDWMARYAGKKEALRQAREQLAAERERAAGEGARQQARLEAACARLARLATDFGLSLRRCIALELQPLSASALTASPRSQPQLVADPNDVGALAGLLERQGAALVDALESAMEQALTAREERTRLESQLAARNAVLDELRGQLARQGLGGSLQALGRQGPAAAQAAGPGAPAGVGLGNGLGQGGTALGAWAAPRAAAGAEAARMQLLASVGLAPRVTASPRDGYKAPGVSTYYAAASAAAAAGSTSARGYPATSPRTPPEGAGGYSPTPSPNLAGAAAARSDPSPRSAASPSSIAQDVAALTASHAGLRSALQHMDPPQRGGSRAAASSSPTSLYAAGPVRGYSAAYAPVGPAGGAAGSYSSAAAVGTDGAGAAGAPAGVYASSRPYTGAAGGVPGAAAGPAGAGSGARAGGQLPHQRPGLGPGAAGSGAVYGGRAAAGGTGSARGSARAP